jgi:hypothetical protein
MRTPRRILACMAVFAFIATLAQPALAAPDLVQPHLVSQNPADWTPRVMVAGRQDGVHGIAQVGNTVVVGGSFTQVSEANGPWITRNNIFAFDVTNGQISSTFVPAVDGKVESVQAAGDGKSVFIGGYFSTVNGVVTKRLAKLDVDSGQLVSGFKGKVTAGKRVMDMEVRGGVLYVGGQFSKFRHGARDSLAALDPTTGDPLGTVNFDFAGKNNGGPTRVQRFDVSGDGKTLVAIGNFTTVDGLDRWQIVKIDLSTSPASIADWETDRYKRPCVSKFDSYMRDVDIAPDGSHFLVATTGAFMGGPGAGVLCDTVTRWPMSAIGNALQPVWADYTGGDTTWTVLSTGSAIYVGGHMRWENNSFRGDAAGPGAVVRQGTAALDPLNGLPLDYNPRRDPRREGVFELYPTADGLWYGTDSCCIAGERHEQLHFMPLAGGEDVPAPSTFSLPGEVYQLPSAGRIDHRSFDGAVAGSTSSVATSENWSSARGAFMTNGRLYTGWSDGTFRERTFDGTNLGPSTNVDLHGLTNSYFPVSSISGMFLDGGRLYYTVSGSSNLYYRYFTPSSDVVGAEQFVASTSSDGFNWSSTLGMFIADGEIYVAQSNGNLNRIDFMNGKPVVGTSTSVNTSVDWRGHGLFMLGS